MTIGGGVAQHSHLSASSGGLLPAEAAALIHIQTQDANNSASLDFINLDAYDRYLFVGSRIQSATDGNALLLRVSQNNGVSWISTVNTYRYQHSLLRRDLATLTYQSDAFATESFIGMAFNLSIDAGEVCSFDLEAHAFPTIGVDKWISYNAVQMRATVAQLPQTQAGGIAIMVLNKNPINGLRFLGLAGNISSGRISLYGYKV